MSSGPGGSWLGIGSIIGAGLFSLTGIVAAENAGPALGPENWWRLIVWLVVGLAIYFGYSRGHSRQQLAATGAD